LGGGVLLGCDAAQRLIHFGDRFVGRGGSSRQSDDIAQFKPRGLEIPGFLHVMHAGASASTRGHEFAGVVAVRTSNDDDDGAVAGQGFRGMLAKFGGLADRVTEADLAPREPSADSSDKMADAFDRLGCLGDDSEAWVFDELIHVGFRQHHVVGAEVFRHSANFRVVALAYDHGMETLRDKFHEGGMGDVDERTSSFKHVAPSGPGRSDPQIRSAMGRDQHGGGGDFGGVRGEPDAGVAQLGEDAFVVDQFTENRDGSGFRVSGGE